MSDAVRAVGCLLSLLTFLALAAAPVVFVGFCLALGWRLAA